MEINKPDNKDSIMNEESPNALDEAITLILTGELIPVDLAMTLNNQGYDVEMLEEKFRG